MSNCTKLWLNIILNTNKFFISVSRKEFESEAITMKKSVSGLDDSVLCSNSWDWLLGLLGTGHGPCWPVEQLTAGDLHDGLTEVEITLRQREAARRWRLPRPCSPEEGIFNLTWQIELITITKDVKIHKNRTAILIQMVLRTCKLNSTQLKWVTDQTMASSKS